MHNQFKTKKEAIAFLDSIDWLTQQNNKKYYPKGAYSFSHGEYAQPDYYPARYKDGWAIRVDYFYKDWACNVPKSGRVDEETFFNTFLINN